MYTVVIALSLLGALGGTLAQEEAAIIRLPPLCLKNEHYERDSNRCQITCANMQLEDTMGACFPTSACYCNSGYVRNYDGLCIKREQCPPPQKCGRNEHYERDSNRCQITCENRYQEPLLKSCYPASSACICNDGYARTKEGVCIKKDNCPIPICGPNEHYEMDSHSCQLSCDDLRLESVLGPCFASSGCYCNKGYVRNRDKYCIKRDQCPPTCYAAEHYLNQTTQCHITCQNMALEPYMGPCYPSSGCFCLPGYVQDNYGTCIKRKDCPRPPRCGINEVPTNCYNDCQTTCKNRIIGDDKVCLLDCTRTGCVCKLGHLRHENGTCVPVDQCSPPDCNQGEVYTTCGSSCPTTCQTRGDTCKVCPAVCVPGCFCAETTIRAPNGTCVEPRNCPKRTCSGANQYFDPCPPTCPPTQNCSNIWSRIDCSNPIDCCKPQCRCKPGYFRDSENKCVTRQQCGSPRCGVNEVSTNCYNDCQRTCKNRIIGDNKVCTLACTRTGCVCKKGYLRHDNGTCVPEYQCSPPDCNKGEVYTPCGSSCPTTCQTRGDTCKVCLAVCVPGCFCAGTTIRAPNGTCVEPRNCPKRTCSGANQYFDSCPPTCPPTENCSNIWSRFNCSDPIDCCKPQCRCKSGYYRDSQNNCISTKQCMANNGDAEADEPGYASATADAGPGYASATADAQA